MWPISTGTPAARVQSGRPVRRNSPTVAPRERRSFSQCSDPEINAIVAEFGLPTRTENTITDVERLTSAVERVRERGIAIEREEQYEGVNSVAVPLTDLPPNAAIYVAGSAERLSSKRIEEDVPGILLSAASEVTKRFLATS